MSKPIWFKAPTIAGIHEMSEGTMLEHLGIEITELGDDALEARMPVDHRTVQPARILHGGASVALSESLASIGANLIVDPAAEYCVGLEINANHVRAATQGFVTARSTPLHVGRTTQVWETRIHQNQKLVCVSRITMAVLTRPADQNDPRRPKSS